MSQEEKPIHIGIGKGRRYERETTQPQHNPSRFCTCTPCAWCVECLIGARGHQNHGEMGFSTGMPSLGKRAGGIKRLQRLDLGAVAAPLSCAVQARRISDRGVGDRGSAGRWDGVGELGWGVVMTERRHIGSAALLCCSAALLPVVGRGQRVGSSAGARQGCPTPCGASHWHPTAAQHRSFQVPSSVVRFLLGSCLPKNFIPAGPSSHAWPAWPACLPACFLPHPCSTTLASR